MKKRFGYAALIAIALFLIALPVQADIVYLNLTHSIAGLIMILLAGPALAVIAGFRDKMKKR